MAKKTWLLLVEIEDDGEPELLSREEIEHAIFGDLVSGLTGKIIAFVTPFSICRHEWGSLNNKRIKCVRPKNHKGPHSNRLEPEDING